MAKYNPPTPAPKSPLKTEPKNVLPDSPKAPTAQKVGTAISLKDSPGPQYGAGTPDGNHQIVGTQIKLQKSPTLGFTSASTPMSDRAVESKKNVY